MREKLKAVADYEAPVILICGANILGKAPVVRFVINRLLGDFPAVEFFDCDISRSLLNPRGCVAWHTVTKPLLGPGFVSDSHPDYMSYYGGTDYFNRFQNYTDVLKFAYTRGLKRGPLVVNSMGTARGAGYSILRETARLTKPDLLIQLKKPHEESVSAQLFRGDPPALATVCPLFSQRDEIKHPDVSYRMLWRAAYFGMDPYEVKDAKTLELRDLAIYFTQCANIVPSAYLKALRGAAVGLLVADDCGPVVHESGLRIAKKLPMGACKGFGIVKEVDVIERTILIWTPVESSDFRKVNVIIRGSISTPEGIFPV